jgi:hypothetical protein
LDELKKERFLWGVAPGVGTMDSGADGIGYAFRGITAQKATGLGAVACGLSESFVWAGIGAILIREFVAIILLCRAFSPGHWLRGLFSALSIRLSGLMLLLLGFFFWLSWFSPHHSF